MLKLGEKTDTADVEGNIIEEKSFDFAVRIVKLCNYLKAKKKEAVLSKQLLRCGTSVGANVFEAQKAQTTADFYTKMTIALKEANETSYWLKLMYSTNRIDEQAYIKSENIRDCVKNIRAQFLYFIKGGTVCKK